MANQQEVEKKALTVVEQAKAINITDSETYIAAGAFWKDVGLMIKEVKETFDPICEAANKAHKQATAKRAQFLNPLNDAYKNVKKLMSNYDAEQERIRQEEQRRLEDIARKEEEERQLQAAIEAEENGEIEESEAIMQEEFKPPPVIVPKSIPKMSGGPVFREIWSAELVDIRLLCEAVLRGTASPECVMANMPVLNKLATALKSSMNIPGVKAVSRRV